MPAFDQESQSVSEGPEAATAFVRVPLHEKQIMDQLFMSQNLSLLTLQAAREGVERAKLELKSAIEHNNAISAQFHAAIDKYLSSGDGASALI